MMPNSIVRVAPSKSKSSNLPSKLLRVHSKVLEITAPISNVEEEETASVTLTVFIIKSLSSSVSVTPFTSVPRTWNT